MNLEQIEAIKNVLVKNVLATCWNFADQTEDSKEYGCDIHNELFNLTRSDAWDRELTTKDRKVIQIELRAYIKGLVNWQQFWEEVLKEYEV